MPKTSKPAPHQRCFYALHPWRIEGKGESCDLIAYVEASGDWETVATIPATSGASADDIASFIAGLVNDNRENAEVLDEAFAALGAVLQEGLTFTTEQEAEHVLKRLKRRGFS
jgi:hypothetical protein